MLLFCSFKHFTDDVFIPESSAVRKSGVKSSGREANRSWRKDWSAPCPGGWHLDSAVEATLWPRSLSRSVICLECRTGCWSGPHLWNINIKNYKYDEHINSEWVKIILFLKNLVLQCSHLLLFFFLFQFCMDVLRNWMCLYLCSHP